MLRLAGTISYCLCFLVTKILVCQGGCNEACIETQPSGVLRRVGQELGPRDERSDIFFHEVAARKMGLMQPIRCLDLISRAESSEVTAGDLGRATGLTTGAVTGFLIGLRQRAGGTGAGSNDRRRVIVRPLPRLPARMGNVYEGLGAAMTKLASGYGTKEFRTHQPFS